MIRFAATNLPGLTRPRPFASVVAGFVLASALLGGLILSSAAEAAPVRPAPALIQSQQAQPVRSVALPGHCVVEIGSRRHAITVLPERCLREAGVRMRLPMHCAEPARLGRRTERVFEARCLRAAGFRIAQPRDMRPPMPPRPDHYRPNLHRPDPFRPEPPRPYRY